MMYVVLFISLSVIFGFAVFLYAVHDIYIDFLPPEKFQATDMPMY